MKQNPPPAERYHAPGASALLIMPPARRAAFQQVLSELGVNVHFARDCREARELLRSTLSFRLVVTSLSLPDGNWCDVMRMVTDLEVPASVVVHAPEINPTLWSEVFWRGAYDLLPQSSDWSGLRACLEGALRAQPFSTRFPTLALSA